MSVLIAHPGVGPFVRANVEALAEHELLDRFATTVVEDPHSSWQRLIAFGGPLTRGLRALIQRRQAPSVPRNRIVTRPLRELVRASLSRLDRSGVWADRAWDWMSHDFATWAGRCLSGRTRAVFGSEYNALEMFEAARSRGLPCILELPSAEHDFVASMVSRERERSGSMQPDAYAKHTEALRQRRTDRRKREAEMATLVVVNSSFARDSYERAGYPIERFVVLPLGAPEFALRERCANSGEDARVRFIWGGNFAWHKGASVLLDALVPLSGRTDIHLDIFGQVHLPRSTMGRLPPWAHVHGAVPRERFIDALARSDVLLHPSLSDGFAMVVTEAMALGVVPVVTTSTGAATLVSDGQNGRLLPAGDVDALRDAIEWCVANRARLPDMGNAAGEAARRWTWRDYRRAFAGIVGDHLAA